MAGIAGFGQLGNALAGGGALPAALAEAQGESLGANTQNAIVEAQGRLAKQKALAQIGQATPTIAAAEQDPTKLGAALALFAQAGVNPTEFTSATGANQRNNSYNTIINPETPDDIVARHLVAEGKEGGLLHMGQQGEYSNVLHPEQGVQVTQLGQSLAEGNLALKRAQQENYQAEAAKNRALAAAGGKPVGPNSKYQFLNDEQGNPVLDEHGNRVVVPTTGGAADINSPQPMGAVTSRYFQNSMNAGLQGATALANAMRQPGSSTAGLLASVKPGHSIVGALTGQLATAVTPEEDQNLNTILTGLEQNLAVVDNSGRVANQAYVDSMSRIKLQPGNTVGARMLKLAEARQVLENGLQSWLDTASLNEHQKASLQRNLTTIQTAIPFTVADVQAAIAAHQTAPQPTIADRARSALGLGTGTPATAPRQFATEAEAEAANLAPGTKIIVGGRPATWQ